MISIFLIIFVFFPACSFLESLFIETQPADVVEIQPADVVEIQPADVVEIQPADVVEIHKYLEAYRFGTELIKNTQFDDFINWIPGSFINNPMYLLRIDLLPLGNKISILKEYDVAFEEGMQKGLIERNIVVHEKLDDIHFREFEEYLNTIPENAFYMNSLESSSLDKIKEKYGVLNIITYQIFSIDYKNKTAFVNFRLVNLENKKIISSAAVCIKEDQKNISKKYYEVYDAVLEHDFPPDLFLKLNNTAFINIDIINIAGNYSQKMSDEMISIENGLISGIIHKNSNKNKPFVNEKIQGYLYKYPGVYNDIVYNTNPLIYDTWEEFIENTGCTELVIYRILSDEGIYLRIVDTKNNGQIIFSDVIAQKNKNLNFIRIHEIIKREFDKSFPWDMVKNNKIFLINGDDTNNSSPLHTINKNIVNKMQLVFEEGIISSIANNGDAKVYEKLTTLYLKKPYMFEGKAFNLNPLYLNSWQDLEKLNVDFILVYNNLIDYDKHADAINSVKIALNYRLIDVHSGKIIFSDILLNNFEEL